MKLWNMGKTYTIEYRRLKNQEGTNIFMGSALSSICNSCDRIYPETVGVLDLMSDTSVVSGDIALQIDQ